MVVFCFWCNVFEVSRPLIVGNLVEIRNFAQTELGRRRCLGIQVEYG
jgi:hypothetical protein